MLGTETTLDPIQLILTQAGVAGAVVVLMLVGWLWPKMAVQREFQRADDRDKQQQALIDTMLAVYHKEVLPTLAEIDKRLVPLLEDVSDLLKRVQVLLDQQEQIVKERQWAELQRVRREGESGRGVS